MSAREREAYEWQQAMSWELGCPWGSTAYTLEQCVAKIRELKRPKIDQQKVRAIRDLFDNAQYFGEEVDSTDILKIIGD